MRGFKGGLRILFYLLAAINQTAYMTQLFISSVNLFDSAFTVALFPLLIYMLVAFSNADGNNITCNFVPLIFLHQDVSFTPFHPVYCFFCIFPAKTNGLSRHSKAPDIEAKDHDEKDVSLTAPATNIK